MKLNLFQDSFVFITLPQLFLYIHLSSIVNEVIRGNFTSIKSIRSIKTLKRQTSEQKQK